MLVFEVFVVFVFIILENFIRICWCLWFLRFRKFCKYDFNLLVVFSDKIYFVKLLLMFLIFNNFWIYYVFIFVEIIVIFFLERIMYVFIYFVEILCVYNNLDVWRKWEFCWMFMLWLEEIVGFWFCFIVVYLCFVFVKFVLVWNMDSVCYLFYY